MGREGGARKRRNPFHHMIGGVLSGATSTLIFHPLDVVKVRFQVSRAPISRAAAGAAAAATKTTSSSAAAAAATAASSSTLSSVASTSRATTAAAMANGGVPRYGSVAGAFSRIVKEEGATALWKGITPALFGSATAWGLYMFCYEASKNRKLSGGFGGTGEPVQGRLRARDHLLSSLEAGCIVSLVLSPVWLIKTRMQLQIGTTGAATEAVAGSAGAGTGGAGAAGAGAGGAAAGGAGAGARAAAGAATATGPATRPAQTPTAYRGLFDAFRRIIAEEGVRGLYRGIVPQLLLTSHGAVQFMVYEELKSLSLARGVAGSPSSSSASAAASKRKANGVFKAGSLQPLAIGACSKIVATTVTYPYQVVKARLQQRHPGGAQPYKGTIDCFAKMFKQEGIRGYYKGLAPNLLRVAPSAACTFYVYECVVSLLRND